MFIQSIETSLIEWMGITALLISYLGLIVLSVYSLITNKVPRKLLAASLILSVFFFSVLIYKQFEPRYEYKLGDPAVLQ